AVARSGPQWTVEPFTDAFGGGPATGPAVEARGSADTLCGDKHGNIFVAANQYIDIITPNGQRQHVAGTGHPGYRDGPAYRAEFRMGLGSYYALYNIACGPGGDVYIADSGNMVVRRLFKTSDGWKVTTVAGGGAQRLDAGASSSSRNASFSKTIAVAALPDGAVLAGTYRGVYRIDGNGTRVTFVGHWPESVTRHDGRTRSISIAGADSDGLGNAYFVARDPNVVIRVAPDGAISLWAGLAKKPRNALRIGDGKRMAVFLHAVTSVAAGPSGDAVYVCGGDEYDIRRLPADAKASTSTLMRNGRWYPASIHPDHARGAAVYTSQETGRLKPEGRLTVLMVAPLIGRDGTGALYGKINRWSGMSEYVVDRGLIPTRIFRIRPIAGEPKDKP
ncbi:MAG: hypothetical protein P8173_17875, partial [Gammaproteobacteria bacterium]